MKALDLPHFADENILPEVSGYLRKIGLDIESVAEQGLFGLPDTEVLRQALETRRVGSNSR